MQETITINEAQRLYVIPCGKGYSCLGFDVAYEWSVGVWTWLKDNGQDCPKPYYGKCGTLAGYAEHRQIMALGAAYSAKSGKRCPVLLDTALMGLEGKRVEIVDKYGDHRRFYVGKSTGWLPIHLEIKTRRSTGGMGTYGQPFQSVRVIS
jgi:hypothetical protein